MLQERDTEREIHRKSPAGDTGLNTKYIIVIESKHKPVRIHEKTCMPDYIRYTHHRTMYVSTCEVVKKQNMSTDLQIRNFIVH